MPQPLSPHSPIVIDGYTLHVTAMGQIITNRLMLSDAVIPYSHGILLPSQTSLKFRFPDLLK